MKYAIREFKVWVWCLGIGISVLATEVAVKARHPAAGDLTVAVWQREIVPVTGNQPVKSVIAEEVVTRLLVDSVIQIESAGKPRTVGSKGERGLMQIKEATWRETTRQLFGRPASFSRAFEPELNRQVGTAYLARLHAFLQENRDAWQADERSLLLACYNAGPQRVAKSGFDLGQLPASTRDYVHRASALHDLYLEGQALRLEPARDGNVVQIVQLPSRAQDT